MTTKKKLGIWMDYSTANLMEYSNIFIERKIITSDFTHEEKEQSLNWHLINSMKFSEKANTCIK